MTGPIAALLVALAGSQSDFSLSGAIPGDATIVQSVRWVAAERTSEEVTCSMVTAVRWECRGTTGTGVVVIEDALGVTAVIAVGGHPVSVERARRGRLVRLADVGACSHDSGMEISAWEPERSASRQMTRMFTLQPAADIHVTLLSPCSAWIRAEDPPGDALVRIRGGNAPDTWVGADAVLAGPADEPVEIIPGVPASIDGSVRGADERPVADVAVTLYRQFPEDDHVTRAADRRFALAATTTTDSTGLFRFDPVGPAAYKAVVEASDGERVSVDIDDIRLPIVVHLRGAPKATGRLVHRGTPVPGARVRFVPDTAAWLASTDPRDHLARDVFTNIDGTFVLSLPERPQGSIQFIGPDQASARVRLDAATRIGTLRLGDVSLPDRPRLLIRVGPAPGCQFTATGPLDGLGIAVMPGTQLNDAVAFDLPEPGSWAISASCDGRARAVVPSVVSIPAAAEGEQSVTVQLADGPPDS